MLTLVPSTGLLPQAAAEPGAHPLPPVPQVRGTLVQIFIFKLLPSVAATAAVLQVGEGVITHMSAGA